MGGRNESPREKVSKVWRASYFQHERDRDGVRPSDIPNTRSGFQNTEFALHFTPISFASPFCFKPQRG
ncbi:uncharacterized protein G2W53_024405 [Senna tora]|uniref:Uncharacterized protein n=1 Tax=Senna tora TaxID=362788 RepID=A0A834TDC6_9FABA|nr:uncharacterized protein G2W53_024405 [Senna tora]